MLQLDLHRPVIDRRARTFHPPLLTNQSSYMRCRSPCGGAIAVAQKFTLKHQNSKSPAVTQRKWQGGPHGEFLTVSRAHRGLVQSGLWHRGKTRTGKETPWSEVAHVEFGFHKASTHGLASPLESLLGDSQGSSTGVGMPWCVARHW
jgi:hypothetical protein